MGEPPQSSAGRPRFSAELPPFSEEINCHSVLPYKQTGKVTRAWERIEDSCIKELLLLNTIPLPEDYAGTKIKQLSVAPVFAQCIQHIAEETSISDCIFGAR